MKIIKANSKKQANVDQISHHRPGYFAIIKLIIEK